LGKIEEVQFLVECKNSQKDDKRLYFQFFLDKVEPTQQLVCAEVSCRLVDSSLTNGGIQEMLHGFRVYVFYSELFN
jgi:hypothetical protein